MVRRVVLLALLLAGCLDFEGAAQDYCVNHPQLCAPDSGLAPDAGSPDGG